MMEFMHDDFRKKTPIKFEFNSGAAMEPNYGIFGSNFHVNYFVVDRRLYKNGTILIGWDEEELWELFWKGIEESGAKDFKASYYPEYPVFDGGSWSLDIIWEEDGQLKRICSRGENHGPFRGTWVDDEGEEHVDSNGFCSFEDLMCKELLKLWADREAFEKRRLKNL